MNAVDETAFKGRDFISLRDYTKEEISFLLKTAGELKTDLKAGRPHPILLGKTLGMIFTKSSTRTRVSFEVGMYQLGGHALFLSDRDIQLGRGETIADTARTLARMVNGIMIRTFSHQEVLDLAKYADIPVINGLTDLLHPCQVLGDLMTILEHKGRLEGIKLAFVGDSNNVAHALMLGGMKMGMHVVIASPQGYMPDPQITALAMEDAGESGGCLEIMEDPLEAVKGADVLYTDVWASMGQEEEAKVRRRALQAYQINGRSLELAHPDAIFLHCLPAKRGEEVTDEVMEGPHSVIFDEAENRLHAQKAIMSLLMK